MEKLMSIISKGNGRNFYGIYEDGKVVEVVKEGGRFYLAKYSEKFGLTAMGNPIHQFTFIS